MKIPKDPKKLIGRTVDVWSPPGRVSRGWWWRYRARVIKLTDNGRVIVEISPGELVHPDFPFDYITVGILRFLARKYLGI